MVQCFVPGCKNRTDSQNWKKNSSRSNNVKVSFHGFPKDPSLWLNILGIKSSSVSKSARICSVHFEEKFFDRTRCYPRLRPNALPCKILITEELSGSANENETLTTDANLGELSHTTEPSTSKANKEAMTPLDDISNSFDECPLSSQPSASKLDKGTMVSPSLIYNSPEKSRLRKRIKFLESESKKKMQVIQQKLRRKTNQVLILKSILDTLKDK